MYLILEPVPADSVTGYQRQRQRRSALIGMGRDVFPAVTRREPGFPPGKLTTRQNISRPVNIRAGVYFARSKLPRRVRETRVPPRFQIER